MIHFPVESLLNSANPSGISRYKIRKNNPLHSQHLRHPLVSAHSKGTSTPLDSAVTRPLSLTPVESTLTKNRGRGVVLVFLTKNSRNFVYPERLSRGASLILALVLSLTDDCGLMTDDCLPTDDYFLNRSIGLRHAGHWLAPSEAEGSLVTGHCLCYNSARRGTCREASFPAFASRFGRGPIRLFPVVFIRVAGGGRFALLSPVLAEARTSPVQTHLQSVRLLHVLRGLRLSAAAPLQSSVNPRRQSLI